MRITADDLDKLEDQASPQSNLDECISTGITRLQGVQTVVLVVSLGNKFRPTLLRRRVRANCLQDARRGLESTSARNAARPSISISTSVILAVSFGNVVIRIKPGRRKCNTIA